jgi:hypothetical protein
VVTRPFAFEGRSGPGRPSSASSSCATSATR